MALSTVPVAPRRDHHRSTGDCDPLASARVPRLLALEVPPHRRPSTNRLRGSGADPTHEPREPAVGRTADTWRIVDAWDRGRGIDGRQIYGPPPPTTVPRLEDLPAQPCRWPRFAGFVCRPYDLVRAALWFCHSAPRPQATGEHQRDGQS